MCPAGAHSLALHARALPAALLLLCCLLSGAPVAVTASSDVAVSPRPWLLVDTAALTLSVMRGEQVLFRVDNIAIGSNGATRRKRIHDEKTPLGDFTISAIRDSERFRHFLLFDYPTMDHARLAMEEGRISPQEYRALSRAWRNAEPPPQNTGLGGNLGIHGLGDGDPEIHRLFNWTNGCIAVTNEQIEQLLPLVRVGTRVSVR